MGYSSGKTAFKVLQHIRLELENGEFVALLGENGSGKSTFIRSICGLLPLLSGAVYINGRPLHEISYAALAKQVAVVLTGNAPGFNMSVFDLVASGQMPYTNAFHQLKTEHLSAIDFAMKEMGIEQMAAKPLHALSDGNYQKALVAKALAQQAKLLLLDEPSAYLDFGSKHRLFMRLSDLCLQQGKTVLVSSHDLHLVSRYCSKAILLEGGSAELVPVEELSAHPTFERLGGGFL